MSEYGRQDSGPRRPAKGPRVSKAKEKPEEDGQKMAGETELKGGMQVVCDKQKEEKNPPRKDVGTRSYDGPENKETTEEAKIESSGKKTSPKDPSHPGETNPAPQLENTSEDITSKHKKTERVANKQGETDKRQGPKKVTFDVQENKSSSEELKETTKEPKENTKEYRETSRKDAAVSQEVTNQKTPSGPGMEKETSQKQEIHTGVAEGQLKNQKTPSGPGLERKTSQELKEPNEDTKEYLKETLPKDAGVSLDVTNQKIPSGPGIDKETSRKQEVHRGVAEGQLKNQKTPSGPGLEKKTSQELKETEKEPKGDTKQYLKETSWKVAEVSLDVTNQKTPSGPGIEKQEVRTGEAEGQLKSQKTPSGPGLERKTSQNQEVHSGLAEEQFKNQKMHNQPNLEWETSPKPETLTGVAEEQFWNQKMPNQPILGRGTSQNQETFTGLAEQQSKSQKTPSGPGLERKISHNQETLTGVAKEQSKNQNTPNQPNLEWETSQKQETFTGLAKEQSKIQKAESERKTSLNQDTLIGIAEGQSKNQNTPNQPILERVTSQDQETLIWAAEEHFKNQKTPRQPILESKTSETLTGVAEEQSKNQKTPNQPILGRETSPNQETHTGVAEDQSKNQKTLNQPVLGMETSQDQETHIVVAEDQSKNQKAPNQPIFGRGASQKQGGHTEEPFKNQNTPNQPILGRGTSQNQEAAMVEDQFKNQKTTTKPGLENEPSLKQGANIVTSDVTKTQEQEKHTQTPQETNKVPSQEPSPTPQEESIHKDISEEQNKQPNDDQKKTPLEQELYEDIPLSPPKFKQTQQVPEPQKVMEMYPRVPPVKEPETPEGWLELCNKEWGLKERAVVIPDNADWKEIYKKRPFGRNFLRSPNPEGLSTSQPPPAEEVDPPPQKKPLEIVGDFSGWQISTEEIPVDTSKVPPGVVVCYLPIYSWCVKEQMVDLLSEGLWPEVLDAYQPDIYVLDWYEDSKLHKHVYELHVTLLAEDKKTELARLDLTPENDMSGEPKGWNFVSHIIKSYGPGLRYIHFLHKSKDLSVLGFHRTRVADSTLFAQLRG